MVATSATDGAIDAAMFAADIEQMLVPKRKPCDTIIMDDLSS
jgi:hypothetical protein